MEDHNGWCWWIRNKGPGVVVQRQNLWAIRERQTMLQITRGYIQFFFPWSWVCWIWVYPIIPGFVGVFSLPNAYGSLRTFIGRVWGIIVYQLEGFFVPSQTAFGSIGNVISIHYIHTLHTLHTLLVGGLEHFLFSHIFRIIIPIDFHIFQRGWNHLPPTRLHYIHYILSM